MWRRLNRLGGGAASLIVTGIAAAQPAAKPVPEAPPAQPPLLLGEQPAADPAAPPDAARAMQCYRAVDDWVHRWQTPMDPVGQSPLPAASVTLRYQGSIVGRGVAVASQPEGASGILMMATSRALNEAKERMPVDHDALFDENLKAAAAHIAITVEVAGRLIPIQPDGYADAVSLVAPGREGVAVRMGDAIDAIFPETMLATGTDAAAAIRALVAKTSGNPELGLKEPKELREKNGAAFYRFKVTVVGQAGEGKQPKFFHRGGRVGKLSDLGERGLRSWADELARHLVEETQDNAVRAGPSAGSSEASEPAPVSEQVLCSLALGRYVGAIGADKYAAERACPTAASIMRWVASATHEGHSDLGVATHALIWFRSSQPCAIPTPREGFEPLDMGHLYGSAVGATTKDVQTPDQVPVAAAGITACAMVFANANEGGDQTAHAYLVTPPGELVSQMPWLGWADLRLHEAGDIPSAPALREMRSQLWAHQLQAQDLSPDDRDLAGGIVFTTNRQPLPTWQAARPLAFVATMLGDPRLTEDKELASETVRLLQALRYLRQLTAEEPEAHMYKDPARAIGGVRASVFDQRMPPEATAMTLMAVCETIKSLDAIKARQAAAAPK